DRGPRRAPPRGSAQADTPGRPTALAQRRLPIRDEQKPTPPPGRSAQRELRTCVPIVLSRSGRLSPVTKTRHCSPGGPMNRVMTLGLALPALLVSTSALAGEPPFPAPREVIVVDEIDEDALRDAVREEVRRELEEQLEAEEDVVV